MIFEEDEEEVVEKLKCVVFVKCGVWGKKVKDVEFEFEVEVDVEVDVVLEEVEEEVEVEEKVVFKK